MSDFVLNIREPVHVGSHRVGRLNSGVTRWKRTRKSKGGAYSGTATTGHGDMRAAYTNWLGLQLHENAGRDWHGIIRTLTWRHAGITEKMSLDEMANSVACIHADSAGNEAITPFVQDADSVGRYGEFQDIIEVQGDVTEANEAIQAYLAKNAWPKVEQTDIHPTEQNERLTVEGVGPVYMLRWQFPDLVAQVAADNNTVAGLVGYIADSHPYLSRGNIESNATVASVESYKTSLEHLENLLTLSNGEGRPPYTYWIDNEHRLHYGPISVKYLYQIVGGQFKKASSGLAQTDVRSIWPGVVRHNALNSGVRPGFWLLDKRDVLIDEMTVDENGMLKPGKPQGKYVVTRQTEARGSRFKRRVVTRDDPDPPDKPFTGVVCVPAEIFSDKFKPSTAEFMVWFATNDYGVGARYGYAYPGTGDENDPDWIWESNGDGTAKEILARVI